MQADKIPEQRLIEKIRQLVPEQVILVENFIDSLPKQNENYNLTLAATKLSEPTLQKIWDNPEDAEYEKADVGLDAI
ncbi:MAG: toxin-antitoxin system, antitoxin component, Xre family protein [Cyanobacteria bacterium J06621_15]